MHYIDIGAHDGKKRSHKGDEKGDAIRILKRWGLPTRKYVRKTTTTTDYLLANFKNIGYNVDSDFVQHITNLVDKLAEEAKNNAGMQRSDNQVSNFPLCNETVVLHPSGEDDAKRKGKALIEEFELHGSCFAQPVHHGTQGNIHSSFRGLV